MKNHHVQWVNQLFLWPFSIATLNYLVPMFWISPVSFPWFSLPSRPLWMSSAGAWQVLSRRMGCNDTKGMDGWWWWGWCWQCWWWGWWRCWWWWWYVHVCIYTCMYVHVYYLYIYMCVCVLHVTSWVWKPLDVPEKNEWMAGNMSIDLCAQSLRGLYFDS